VKPARPIAMCAVLLTAGLMLAFGAVCAGAAEQNAAAVSGSAQAAPPLPSSALEGAATGGGVQVGPSLPAPTAPEKSESVEGSKASKPGLLDIPGQIEAAINEWFAGLVKDALDPVMVLVGRTLLSTPQIAGQAQVRSYWQLAAGVADSLLVLVVIVAGAIVMSHETLQSSYTIKEILPRIALAAVLVNASLALSGQMVSLANVLSGALLGGGVSPEQAGHTLERLIIGAIAGGGIFLVLIGLVCALLAVALLVVYLVRAAAIVFLVGSAPIFLLAHGLPQTEGMARMWWRLMLACLGVQVAQALVLAGAVHVFFSAGGNSVLGLGSSGGLVSLLIALCLLYILLRIPFWAKDMAFPSRYASKTGRMVKGYVLFRVLRGTLGGVV
jgi:hypothetical protein